MSQLTKLVDDYYSSYDYRNLRDESKAQYKYFLNVMMNTEVEGKPLCRYDYKQLPTRVAKVAYNEWCEKGIHMANHILSCTRIVFNHGLRMELCVTNPFANIRRRAAEKRKTVWSREDVRKLLDVAYGDFSTRNIGLIAHMAYECSPPLPLPSPPKYCGLRFAVSNTPAVMNTPAISKACMAALIPNTTTEPTHIEKIMHHIHASICMTMCLVFVSGMLDSGLYLLSMISLYALFIVVISSVTFL